MQLKYEHIDGYPINVVLPTGYTHEKRYPTIYLHDGGNGAQQVMNYLEHLIITKQIAPVIIIGITPKNRNEEYTPWKIDSFYGDNAKIGGQAKIYLNTVVHQIKPLIDSKYATNPSAEYTTIGGCSFGGLVSVFASYYYPEVFKNYILLSASFWYEDVLAYIQGHDVHRDEGKFKKPLVDRTKQRMYVYVGELEGIYHQSPQRLMVPHTKQAVQALLEEGFDQKNLRFNTTLDGTHDSYFFSQQFIEAVRWLYGKNA